MDDSKLERIPVIIEVARAEDLPAMAQLRYENIVARMDAGKLPEENVGSIIPEEGIKELIPVIEKAGEDEYFLVAKRQGQVVGMCGMFWRPEHERFQFRRFYVRTELQKKKIGGQLFRNAKERAQHSPHSPKGMYLLTDQDNEEAQEIYERWGFRETGREDNWVRMELDF